MGLSLSLIIIPLIVLAKYLNNKYLNNRDIWYCENAICDKKGTYNIEIELVSNTNDFGLVIILISERYCLNFQRIYQKPLMKYHNFLQTLKIQKSPMKKFHFRHQLNLQAIRILRQFLHIHLHYYNEYFIMNIFKKE